MGYWLYYLACIGLAYAVDRPWVAFLGLVFVALRPFIADPIVFLDTVGESLDLHEQLDANPADVKAQRDLACLWLRRDRPRRALALLLEADRRDPGNADTLYLLGLARLRAGDPAGALEPLVRAADIDPRVRFGEPYLVAGEALLQLERFEEAEDALEHYTRVNSSSVRGYCLLSSALAARGRMNDAREALDGATSTYREVPAFRRKGQLGAWLSALSGAPLCARWALFRRAARSNVVTQLAGGAAAVAVIAVAVVLLGRLQAPGPERWAFAHPPPARTNPGPRNNDGTGNQGKRKMMPSEQSTEQGVALVRQVIEKVKASDLGVLDPDLPRKKRRPRPLAPEVIASLRLPGNRPLSPSLAEWLAFDASFLGWFKDRAHPVVPEMNVGQGALVRFTGQASYLGAYFNGLTKGALPGLCLPLPLGDETGRLLYLSEPDALGEYPVLLIDIDDRPLVSLEYPGIDVYLATHAGIIALPAGGPGAYMNDPRFRERMEHHLRHTLSTRVYLELGDDGFPTDPAEVPEVPEPPRIPGPGEPVPEGYRLYEGVNPFTKHTMRFLKRIEDCEDDEPTEAGGTGEDTDDE